MPLPHFNPSPYSQNPIEPVYKNRFATVFIYMDDYYEYLNTEMVDIDMNEKTNERKMLLDIAESTDTPHNFKDIDSIIVDIHSTTGDIKVRKIFEVEFVSYHQRYGSTDGKWKDEISKISLEFDIKNMDVQQDTDLQTLESYIRDRKLKKLIE
jgi:hypothetical protein